MVFLEVPIITTSLSIIIGFLVAEKIIRVRAEKRERREREAEQSAVPPPAYQQQPPNQQQPFPLDASVGKRG